MTNIRFFGSHFANKIGTLSETAQEAAKGLKSKATQAFNGGLEARQPTKGGSLPPRTALKAQLQDAMSGLKQDVNRMKQEAMSGLKQDVKRLKQDPTLKELRSSVSEDIKRIKQDVKLFKQDASAFASDMKAFGQYIKKGGDPAPPASQQEAKLPPGNEWKPTEPNIPKHVGKPPDTQPRRNPLRQQTGPAADSQSTPPELPPRPSNSVRPNPGPEFHVGEAPERQPRRGTARPGTEKTAGTQPNPGKTEEHRPLPPRPDGTMGKPPTPPGSRPATTGTTLASPASENHRTDSPGNLKENAAPTMSEANLARKMFGKEEDKLNPGYVLETATTPELRATIDKDLADMEVGVIDSLNKQLSSLPPGSPHAQTLEQAFTKLTTELRVSREYVLTLRQADNVTPGVHRNAMDELKMDGHKSYTLADLEQDARTTPDNLAAAKEKLETFKTEFNRAYRKEILLVHPDKNGGRTDKAEALDKHVQVIKGEIAAMNLRLETLETNKMPGAAM